MNKKDLIDSFESLTPSDYQKDRMLKNVLSYGMKKNVHKVSFNFKYAFSTAAAALCVLAVVVAVSPMYKYHKLSQPSSQKVTNTDITDDKPTDTIVNTPEVTDGVQSDDSLPNEADKNDNAIQQNEAQGQSDPAPAGDVNSTEEASDNSENVNKGRMRTMSGDEAEIQLNINNGSPPLQNASVYTVSDEGEYEEITLDEYYDYLGVNVGDILNIPAGYSNLTDTTGQINKSHSDKWLFRYTNNNGYIYITTTKHTESVANQINGGYLISDVKGTPAVVFEDDGSYAAYIISEDIAYIVNTSEVPEAEFVSLLQSIVR